MSPISDQINMAIEKNDVQLLQECFSKFGEEECRKSMEDSPLSISQMACSLLKIDVISFLAQKSKETSWVREDFAAQTKNLKGTALHLVLKGKKNKELTPEKLDLIIKIFHQNGLSLDVKNQQEASLLHRVACGAKKFLPCVKTLLDHGANPLAVDRKLNNFLHYNAKNWNNETDAKNFYTCLSFVNDKDLKIKLLLQNNAKNETVYDTLYNRVGKYAFPLKKELSSLLEEQKKWTHSGEAPSKGEGINQAAGLETRKIAVALELEEEDAASAAKRIKYEEEDVVMGGENKATAEMEIRDPDTLAGFNARV